MATGHPVLAGEGDTAKTLQLVTSSLEVTVTTFTENNGCFIGFFDPMPVLLEGLSGLAQGRMSLLGRDIGDCVFLVHRGVYYQTFFALSIFERLLFGAF